MGSNKLAVRGKKAKIIIKDLNVFYREKQVLENIDVVADEKSLTCIVGPSGCGKSTLLMAINRLLDEIPDAHMRGKITVRLKDESFNVLEIKDSELPALRRKIALVFQHPNVLPMSILKNMEFPLKMIGLRKEKIDTRIENALKQVHLWDEVKDRLHSPAIKLSGGQQQRLCLARVLVMEPEILLLDEPTSFLDEGLARRIESLLLELKKKITVVVVSHYWDQVRRLADRVYRFG